MRVPRYVGWPAVAAFGSGIFYWAANCAVFYPLKYPAGWWGAREQIGASDVWLEAADGVKLHAWWLPAPGSSLATLFLHGNAGNVTHRAGHMRAIAEAGSGVLVLDYRGYGRSAGRPDEAGLYADAEAAYQHLLAAGYTPDRVVLHGESLGTAVAVELSSRRPSAGLILESPFNAAREVARTVLPVLGPMMIRCFDSRERIKRVHVPLLVIHGERDTIVPQALGRALFELANEPKDFWSVPGADHNDLRQAAGPEYVERLREFHAKIAR
jgi:fermentation-respiration switch protein FrsA (DUF1100 family)